MPFKLSWSFIQKSRIFILKCLNLNRIGSASNLSAFFHLLFSWACGENGEHSAFSWSRLQFCLLHILSLKEYPTAANSNFCVFCTWRAVVLYLAIWFWNQCIVLFLLPSMRKSRTNVKVIFSQSKLWPCVQRNEKKRSAFPWDMAIGRFCKSQCFSGWNCRV